MLKGVEFRGEEWKELEENCGRFLGFFWRKVIFVYGLKIYFWYFVIVEGKDGSD